MVIFDTLTISDDGKFLVVKAHVSNADYYSNVYITDVFIDTEDTYSSVRTSKDTFSTYSYYHKSVTETKSIEFTINCSALETPLLNNDSNELAPEVTNFSSNLFFVTIMTTDVDNECAPCGFNSNITTDVVLDPSMVYNVGLSYIGELADSCNIPMDFIDFILGWEGLMLFIDSDNYDKAIELFNKLFKNKVTSVSSSCGCHGSIS